MIDVNIKGVMYGIAAALSAHAAAEVRPFHQRFFRGRPPGRTRFRRLRSRGIRCARAVGRPTTGGQAVQHPDHGHFTGRCRDRASQYHYRTAAERIRTFHDQVAVPAGSFARAVAFAMSQPEEVDINEILYRPTRQEL